MALGMGGTILKTARNKDPTTQSLTLKCDIDYEASTTSPLMAVIIDSVAIVYLFYITWDEYKGLPLGLRSGKAKILVLLFDLVFIVLSSVNATLAFESISRFDPDCLHLEGLQKMKWKQDFLASTLLIALLAWLMTFAVSVLRLVPFSFLLLG